MLSYRFLLPLVAALAAVIALLVSPLPALAAVTLSVPSDLPSEVTVGDTAVPTTLEFENGSTGAEGDGLPSPGHADVLTVDSIFATLSCTGGGGPCTVPDVGVIVPNTVAGANNDAVGAAGTACAGINFEITETATPGVYQFTPSSTVSLTAPDGTPQSGMDYCRADYTASVLAMPTIDTNGDGEGVQTRYRVTVNVTHEDAGLADSTGTDPVVVNPPPPTPSPVPTPTAAGATASPTPTALQVVALPQTGGTPGSGLSSGAQAALLLVLAIMVAGGGMTAALAARRRNE